MVIALAYPVNLQNCVLPDGSKSSFAIRHGRRDVRCSFGSAPAYLRSRIRRTKSRNPRNVQSQGLGGRWCLQDYDERCGCGARLQSSFVEGVSGRSGLPSWPTDSLAGCRGVAQKRRLSFAAEKFRQTKRKMQVYPVHSATALEEEKGGRREFPARRQSTFGFMSNVAVEARKMQFMTAAAAAGLSLTLCASALANPIADAWRPTPQESMNLQTVVEAQLRRELQAQIRLQKDWLEEIGQPLSEWSIDDSVRKSLEEKARSRIDESGKSVSRVEMLESEVVPIFRPPAVSSPKKELNSAGNTPESAPDKVATNSQRPTVTVPSPEISPNESSDRTPELVAVAAIPLGPVVSAASRTVGSAVSVAALETAGTVPAVGLLTRIMMHFGGGGVAGAMGATVVYPMDTIKTRMQAQRKDGEEDLYADEWDCLRQLVLKEGPGSLYSGLVPQLIGIAPEKAMKLTVNEILMEMLETQMPGVGTWALEFIAGGGGGFSQVVFTNPMEIVKVRLQTQSKDGKPKNSWDVIKELGVQGLYNGTAMTLARDVPSSAIFFAIYTILRQLYPGESFMAGFVAAIPATVLVTPFDVVKTRLQMEKAPGENEPYKNGYECFFVILHEEGIGALFKGSLARVLKTSPQFGITLMLYNLMVNGS